MTKNKVTLYCAIERFLELHNEYRLSVIEDSFHAAGGEEMRKLFYTLEDSIQDEHIKKTLEGVFV